MIPIIFLCTGNSCRSQMAHGFANALKGDVVKAYSAGTKTHGLNPRAVKVMAEIGIDISHHESTLIDDLPKINYGYIFTVCSDAHENCPYYPIGEIVHVGFDDPPRLTKDMVDNGADEEEILNVYRRVRDEIKDFINSIENHISELN